MLDQSRAPVDLPITEPNAGLNFLAIVRRRWPWVLVGFFVGIVGGLLAYTARPPVYQSNAQILVVKNNPTLTPGGSASVMAYMEDYMSTQATLIKSETVLLNAARHIPDGFRGMPENADERAKLLATWFTVAREKDPNSATSTNNILNVAVKGGDPDDCQQLLGIIIEAYRDILRGIYDEATDRKMKLLESAIESNYKKVEANKAELTKFITQIRAVTQEDPSSIQTRVSRYTDLLGTLRNEETEVRNNLALIDGAGKDRTSRQNMMLRLGQMIRGQQLPDKPSLNDPLLVLRELDAQLAESRKKYGPDHPIIQQMEARKKYLEDLQAYLNPGDPKGEKDGLDQLEAILKNRRDILNQQISNFQAQIVQDDSMLRVVAPLKAQIDQKLKYIETREALIDTFENDHLQTKLTRATGGYEAKTLNQPSRDAAPVAPKLSQSLLLGMAVGLLFGIGLAALAELSDKGFRNPADIRSRLGLAVIGHIPPIRTNLPLEESLDLEPTMVSALRPKSVEAEAYRGVRTALYFNAAGSTHQMIQVTSPSQGDGKSTLAANLAVSIAQSGKRTLLVDCDMRRPRVHRVFHMADPGPGLAAVINGGTPLSAAIQRSAIENLSILPCGKKPANPAELLTSPNFSDLLDRLKGDYDYVILDTPPVLAVSDPSAVAPRADGVILVFRMTNKVRPLAERAREQLQQIGANVIGVVVNGSGRGSDSYGYGGGEYTGYASAGQYMENYESDDDTDIPPKKG